MRLAAVRRLAHEAADTGLLSPELAAGIGRHAKQLRDRAPLVFPTDLDGAHIPSSIGWKDRPRHLHGWARGRVPLEGRAEPGVLLSLELQGVREPPRYQLRCARLFQGLSPGGSRHGADEYAVPVRDRRYNSVRHIVQGFKWTAVSEFTVVSFSPKLHSARGIH